MRASRPFGGRRHHYAPDWLVADRVWIGIIDQVVAGTGILLNDPTDLEAFTATLVGLLGRPDRVARLGHNAHRHVVETSVGDRHLLQYADLLDRLVAG